MLLPIADEIKLRCFDTVFIEMVGGQQAVQMLNCYYGDRLSLRDIGAMESMHHEQVSRILEDAREKLQRCGLWPADWEARGRKGVLSGKA